MTLQVDSCKNFNGKDKCLKCGRMMPAYCFEQEEMERKARLYDEMMSAKSAKVEPQVTEETPRVTTVPPPAPKKVYPKATPKAPKKNG